MAPTTKKRAGNSSSSIFPSTKRDKRHIKRSNLLHKVAKSSQISSPAERNRRRRQKKQLVANISSLADALPASEERVNPVPGEQGVIRRKSMKSRPGAMRRREKLDKGERERFEKNMAEISGKEEKRETDGTAEQKESQQGVTNSQNKWAALRGFITQT